MREKTKELIEFLFMLLVFSLSILLLFIFFIKLIFSEAAAASIGSGLISAGGSIIGGSLTLVGVLWTLKDNQKNTLKRQVVKTRYVYSRLNPFVTAIQNSIKSVTPFNISDKLDLLKKYSSQLESETQVIYKDIQDISDELLIVISSIEYFGSYLKITLEQLETGLTDQEIMIELEPIRNNFAKCDKSLGNLMIKANSIRKMDYDI